MRKKERKKKRKNGGWPKLMMMARPDSINDIQRLSQEKANKSKLYTEISSPPFCDYYL
jgi:hypothetical protein